MEKLRRETQGQLSAAQTKIDKLKDRLLEREDFTMFYQKAIGNLKDEVRRLK